VDDALKTRGIKYVNVEAWLLFSPAIKVLATCLAHSILFDNPKQAERIIETIRKFSFLSPT